MQIINHNTPVGPDTSSPSASTGTIRRGMRITLPRPRDRASAEFDALKKELAELVMEDQMRYTETEIKGYSTD